MFCRATLADNSLDQKSAVSEFTQGAMDLYAQEGFQCRAFRDEQGNVTLGFLAHGFFADAWSSQMLFREVRAAYAALANREKLNFNPALQFADYALAQRRSLDRDLDRRICPIGTGNWSPCPGPGFPMTITKQTGRRGRSYFFVDAGQRGAAGGDIAGQPGVADSGLDGRFINWRSRDGAGRTEILSAAYTADRVRPEFQNTIGFLVTNMPVCGRFDGADRFLPYLRNFAKDFYGSYTHRELSCELYDAIFSPAAPFCATVFNFVPLQKNFFDSEQHAIEAFSRDDRRARCLPARAVPGNLSGPGAISERDPGKAFLQCRSFQPGRHGDIHPAFQECRAGRSPPIRIRSCAN